MRGVVRAAYSTYLPNIGRAKEGAEMVNRAFRLNPHPPAFYYMMTDPFYATGEYDQVIIMTNRVTGETPVWGQLVLAMSYAQLGRQTNVASAKAELLRRYPEFSMERALSDFGGFRDQATLALYLDGVRKAGLPECASQAELQKYPKMTHLALCDARRTTN
jgi:predicted Zn-dependent protease